MKVKIIKCRPDWNYTNRIGEIIQVVEASENCYYDSEGLGYYKLDCEIIPEPSTDKKTTMNNLIPFNYEVWKEKGGRIYYDDREVTHLSHFPASGDIQYAGLLNHTLTVFREGELRMSPPDRVVYANDYGTHIMADYDTIENAMLGCVSKPLHIIEINLTQGTNRIVHNY